MGEDPMRMVSAPAPSPPGPDDGILAVLNDVTGIFGKGGPCCGEKKTAVSP